MRCFLQIFIIGCVDSCLLITSGQAQDLTSIGDAKPLKITGSISNSNILYFANGLNARRDPFSYYFMGNLTLTLFGYSAPFSFSVSNQNRQFQQPFNQFSLHPTYKWVTAHLGVASMSFSPYTLSGHMFNGVGVELNPPGKLKLSAMVGRLQKAVFPDTTNLNSSATPAFERWGYGLKAGYQVEGTQIETSLFTAKDDKWSLPVLSDQLEVQPQENLAASFNVGKRFFRRFNISGELGWTAITANSNAAYNGLILGVFHAKKTTSYYKAFKTTFAYTGTRYTVNAGYERIDPGYRTLGAYYFNNDLENITGGFTTQLFQSKVNISANAGVQRNNLDGAQNSTMRRLVGAANVTFNPNNRLNFTAAYSNFQTYTNVRSDFDRINQLTPYENLDTLNFRQISKNASLNTNYALSTKKNKPQNVSLNFVYQTSFDKQGNNAINQGGDFYNVNSAYTIGFPKKNINVSAFFNLNYNNTATMQSSTLGPTISVSKTFFQKTLKTALNSSFNYAFANSSQVSRILNLRGTVSYTVLKQHNLSLNIVAQNRINRALNGTAITEFTSTLSYNYNFNLDKKEKEKLVNAHEMMKKKEEEERAIEAAAREEKRKLKTSVLREKKKALHERETILFPIPALSSKKLDMPDVAEIKKKVIVQQVINKRESKWNENDAIATYDDMEIESIKINQKGDIIIREQDGNVLKITANATMYESDIKITDKKGNVWIIFKDKKVVKVQ
ncbi:TonB-dependent receptor [Solitalea koreensis]|nr:hypothetical protein [Solitalea koreensis]